jgi:hypothetical protein
MADGWTVCDQHLRVARDEVPLLAQLLTSWKVEAPCGKQGRAWTRGRAMKT